MPASQEMLNKLKGFTNHGARFTTESGENARGFCPFACTSSKGRKDACFTVHVESKAWQCMRCGRHGGWSDFLMQMADYRAKALRGLPAQRLSGNRGISLDTLRAYGVGWDQGQAVWTVPIRALDGTVTNIHRCDPAKGVVFGTVGGKNTLVLPRTSNLDAAEVVWVCEGEWDAMAAWEALRATGSPDAVVGLAGASSVGEQLAAACQGKRVELCFDHDDPGLKADAKAREALQGRAIGARSVHWPETCKPGYDVRDLWTEHDRVPRSFLRALRALMRDEPRAGPAAAGTPDTPAARPDFPSPAIQLARKMTGSGMPHDEVVLAYKKWMFLPNPEVIDVLFGAVLANRLEGDPLWMFLVGPPGCGKSALLMSLDGSPLCVARTTVTRAALVSGKATGGPDPSLLPKLDGRVLIIKDFTTTLKRPEEAREEIFGVLRDAYDGKCVFEFNGLLREYTSKFGIIAGVTAEIEKLSASSALAGERWVKYYMRHGHGRVTAGRQATKRAFKNRKHQAQMRAELIAVAKRVLTRAPPGEPEIAEREEERIIGMAQWTAALRGGISKDKYTRELLYKPATEIGTRLATEFGKLAAGIALFRGKDRVTSDEVSVVGRVARDTAPDIVEEVVRQMYVRSAEVAVPGSEIAKWCRLPWDAIQARLDKLEMLNVVERPGGGAGQDYRLSRSLVRLMRGLDLYAGEAVWRRR